MLLRSAAQLVPEGHKGGSTFGHEVGGLHSLKLTFSFLSALARAVGLRPLTPGVHDEVLPRDQGEGGDEKNHWQIWSDREAAGEYGVCLLIAREVELLHFLVLYLCLTV